MISTDCVPGQTGQHLHRILQAKDLHQILPFQRIQCGKVLRKAPSEGSNAHAIRKADFTRGDPVRFAAFLSGACARPWEQMAV